MSERGIILMCSLSATVVARFTQTRRRTVRGRSKHSRLSRALPHTANSRTGATVSWAGFWTTERAASLNYESYRTASTARGTPCVAATVQVTKSLARPPQSGIIHKLSAMIDPDRWPHGGRHDSECFLKQVIPCDSQPRDIPKECGGCYSDTHHEVQPT